MTKVLKYKIVAGENMLYEKIVEWNIQNEQTAMREAYKGEYTVTEEELPRKGD